MPFDLKQLARNVGAMAAVSKKNEPFDAKGLATVLGAGLSAGEATSLIRHLSALYQVKPTSEIAGSEIREPLAAYGSTAALDLDDEIGELYDEVARLASDNRPGTEAQLDAAWAQLRALQAEEAHEYRQAFENSLETPLDAGSKTLAEAKALRDQLEGLAATDASSENANPPAT